MSKNKILACVLAATLMISGLPLQRAHAASVSKEEIIQKRQEKFDILDKIAKNNADMQALTDKVKKAQAVIDKQREIAGPVLDQYAKAQSELAKFDQRYKKRIVNLYKNGYTNYLSMLLSADNFSEFLSRFEFVRVVTKRDYNLLQERKKRVEEVKKGAEKYTKIIDAQQKAVNEADNAIKEILKMKQQNKLQLNDIEEFELSNADAIIEVNLEEWRSGELFKMPFTGPLHKPIGPEYRVTSGFGWRYHPVLGYSRPHEGIDFGAPLGTPILAAADGIVVGSEPISGYGWIVTIYHGRKNGKNVFTRYAHVYRDQVVVRVGQEVKQGQMIARVGNNGISSGPHLHFEVRYGNDTLPPAYDPLQGWLSL